MALLLQLPQETCDRSWHLSLMKSRKPNEILVLIVEGFLLTPFAKTLSLGSSRESKNVMALVLIVTTGACLR